jgi:general secretion pathway protein F
MPAYQYEALDAQGNTAKGVIEADTAKSARALLRAQALVPLAVDVVAAAASAGAARWFEARVFNSTSLAIWTRQIAGLLTSGLPLERALTAMAEEAEQQNQRNLVASLRAEVNAGSFCQSPGPTPA